MAAGLPLAMPAPAAAQDMKDVAESKLPAAVATAARANVLDSATWSTAGGRGPSPFVVNSRPRRTSGCRCGSPRRAGGDGPELAPNQPDNAPKREERQRLATEWATR
jgi:hypothetical protein